MAEARRPLLKRIAAWTAAVVLLLALYVASAPVADVIADRYPRTRPLFVAAYAPVLICLWYMDESWRDAFLAYVDWGRRKLQAAFD